MLNPRHGSEHLRSAMSVYPIVTQRDKEEDLVYPTVLRMNATPVYRFLSLIVSRLDDGETVRGQSILDCGCGGAVPPLAIFAEQGMEAVGVDISERQLESAAGFVDRTGLDVRLQRADMRDLPFPDAAFDYVYEHYSMCHLSRADTAQAVSEMRRVLKPEGLAFLGVISTESWPPSSYGEERAPGERWMVEDGDEVRHSLFSDAQADRLVSDWHVLLKEKDVLHVGGEELSETDWAALRAEAVVPRSAEEWAAEYERRTDYVRYVHSYYALKKPAERSQSRTRRSRRSSSPGR